MAGDWIKMRSNLRRHPKVVRMASALQADRLRVIGGLHAVWCLFDEHSDDGHLRGYTVAAVDDEIGWIGFSDQMIAIKWLSSDGQDGLTMPEFSTHNGASAKRRAQETDRKRTTRAASANGPESGGDLSAADADKKRTREEKRREEKNTPPKPPKGAIEVPEWVPAEPWADFVAMRRAKGQKTPFTVGAAKGIVAKLTTFREAGQDVARILEQSTINGWADVFEVRPTKGGSNLSALAGAV